jgi:hypothetical protein
MAGGSIGPIRTIATGAAIRGNVQAPPWTAPLKGCTSSWASALMDVSRRGPAPMRTAPLADPSGPADESTSIFKDSFWQVSEGSRLPAFR